MTNIVTFFDYWKRFSMSLEVVFFRLTHAMIFWKSKHHFTMFFVYDFLTFYFLFNLPMSIHWDWFWSILILHDCKIIQQSVMLFSSAERKAPVIISFSYHILLVVRQFVCSSVSTSVPLSVNLKRKAFSTSSPELPKPI